MSQIEKLYNFWDASRVSKLKFREEREKQNLQHINVFYNRVFPLFNVVTFNKKKNETNKNQKKQKEQKKEKKKKAN